jgi:hypothetical protein
MIPADAINVINQLQEHITELIECLRNNKSEASNLLLSELDMIVESVINENKLPAQNINLILHLIAEFQIKEAFQGFDIVLSKGKVSYFTFEVFVYAICNSVTEKDLPALEKYVYCTSYPSDTRIASYFAIRTILRKENLNNFLSKTLDIYPSLDRFENHTLLCNLFEDCYNSHSSNIISEMKALLIRLIIEDEKGYNSSCFKDYFKWLYQLEPTLSWTVQEIIRLVHQYNRQMDNDVFNFSNLQDVGKHIFDKTVSVIESANTDIVKLAVKQMHHYPYNDRPEPITDEDYYSEICVNADILQLPRTILDRVRNQYESIFSKDIKNVLSKITQRKNDLEKTKQEFDKRREEVIEKNNHKDKKIEFDIKSHIDELDEIGISLKRCDTEFELLEFYEKQIKVVQTSFCENNTDESIDLALKTLALRFVKYSENNTTGIKIGEYFDQYKRVIEQIAYLADPDSTISSNDLIFDKIIFIPFLKKIRENTREIERYKEQISVHPLNPENLKETRADPSKYVNLLKQHSEEAVNNIREVFSKSVALAPRKDIIEKCIELFLDKEYKMFVNVIPIQIEGMFDNLLRSMVFDLFTDIDLHPTAVLRNKIEILKRKNVNSFFEVEAYFKYYFNGIIRNTIAHGNFAQLSDSSGSYQKLALELIFGLNYFADTIFSINELDAMNEYIHRTAFDLNKCEQEGNINDFYECLFSDLNGTRSCLRKSNYKSGLFKAYSPKQILWWMFNPFYESFCKYSDKLNKLRDLLKLPEFWNYVLDKLNEQFTSPLFNKDEFESVVKKMFSIPCENLETIEILKKINKSLKSRE